MEENERERAKSSDAAWNDSTVIGEKIRMCTLSVENVLLTNFPSRFECSFIKNDLFHGSFFLSPAHCTGLFTVSASAHSV